MRRLNEREGMVACSHRDTARALLPWLALIAIVGIALGLRIDHLSAMSGYYGDQGRDSTIVENMISNGSFPLLGPTASTGTFHRGPVWYYLLLPSFLLSGGDPIAGALTNVIADVLAVLMLVLVGRKVAGWAAGLTAGAFWATNGVTVGYARMEWNPQVIAPLEMLVLLCLFALSKGRSKCLLVLMPALAMAWQMHDQALLLLPMIAVWWAIVRPRVSLRLVAASLGLAILVTAPFLVYELSHDFANSAAMVAVVLSHGSGSPGPAPSSQLGSIIEIAGTFITGPAGFAIWLAAAVGFIWAARRAAFGENRPTLLAVILLVPTMLLYAFWPVAMQDYYLYILAPAPLLFAGFALATTRERLTSWKPQATGVLNTATAIVIVGIVAVGGGSLLLAARSAPVDPRSVASMKAQVAAIESEARGAPFSVRLVTKWPYESWDAPYRYILKMTAGPSSGRVDVQTFVIYDSPDPTMIDGQPVSGARIVAYPAPTTGPDLVGDGPLSRLDAISADPTGAKTDAARACRWLPRTSTWSGSSTGAPLHAATAGSRRRFPMLTARRCAQSGRRLSRAPSGSRNLPAGGSVLWPSTSRLEPHHSRSS